MLPGSVQTSADSCSLRMDLRILPVVWDPTGIFAVTTVRQPGGMLVLPLSKDQESETLFLEEYTSSPPIPPVDRQHHAMFLELLIAL